MKFRNSDQNGFVLISVLTLLPLMLAALVVIAASFLLFQVDGKTRHLCRTSLLSAQAEIAIRLQQLIDLNDQAKILRARRLAAEATVLAVAGTPAEAGAQVELQTVIAEQSAFSAQQNKLLVEARLLSQATPARTLGLIKASIAHDVRVHDHQQLSPLDAHGTSQPARFSVIAFPPDSLTPDYQPAPLFQKQQEMRVTWSFDLLAFLPAWMRAHLKWNGHFTSLQAAAGCSTTIEKEGSKWQPKITMAKSQLSSYFARSF